MIEAKNISKKFYKNIVNEKKPGKKNKQEFFALDQVSFCANKGEILGVLGPNGAGKTTLLRILGKLMTPTDGEVIVTSETGENIKDVHVCKSKIGYLSGNTKLYPRLSTREMLSIFAEIYGMDKALTEQRIEEIIQVLKMEAFCDNRIEKLSTGQTQRANIARCLIHDPDIYIFDEPTLGLDIISSESIIEFMKMKKEQNKTILYSTHYMEEAQYLCDQIVMLYEGKIIAEGSPEELMERTSTNNLRDTFKYFIKESEGKYE